MSAEMIGVIMIICMAPAVTAFPIVYGFMSPWRRTLVGKSLMVSSVGLALLVDISLAYQFLGDDYMLRDVVRLTVFGIILLGAWMQLIALVLEKARARRSRRAD